MDILLDWRELFKQGLPLTNIIEAKLKSAFLKIGKDYYEMDTSYIGQLMYNGYYGFEAMTERNLDDSICGLCGTAGQVYFGDGNEKSCCSLSEVDLEGTTSNDQGEVSLESYLEKVKLVLLERSTFAKPELNFRTRISDIPPVIAPSMRKAEINTETAKKSVYLNKTTKVEGDPVLLDKYMRDSGVSISDIDKYNRQSLLDICTFCNIPVGTKSNDMLKGELHVLYATIIVGTSQCHEFTKSAGHSGGFYHIVFRHGCTVASKFMILTESVRDAADLYLSLKYPPVAFICDTPCTMVRHINNRAPDVANSLWGKFDGCFEEPTLDKEPRKDVDIPYIVPSEYCNNCGNFNTEEDSQGFVHPVSNTARRFVVGDRFHSAVNPHKSPL